MFFTKKGKVTIVLAFVLLFSIVSSAIGQTTANAAKKKTYGMTKVQTNFLDNYWSIVHKLCEKSIKNGLGDSDYALMAQIGLESGHLTSDLAQDKNNCLGIDAYPTESQSAYTHARWFDSLEDCFAYHTDLIVRKYKTAASHYDDPYAFIECVAGTYAPGSDNYIRDIKNLIDKYALYNAQRYWPKIREAQDNVRRAETVKLATENDLRQHLKYREGTPEISTNYGLSWLTAHRAVQKVGFIDLTELSYRKTLKTIEKNLKDRKAELRKARKETHSTYHTIALGISYGRISATRENLGSSYNEIMAEYKKLNN